MGKKRKQEKKNPRFAGYKKTTEADFNLSRREGEVRINPLDVAKDLIIALTKLLHLPHEGRSNTHSLFSDLLYKNVQEGNLNLPLEVFHQMGLEISMLALNSASVITQIQIEESLLRLDHQAPCTVLPAPLAVLSGTTKPQ